MVENGFRQVNAVYDGEFSFSTIASASGFSVSVKAPVKKKSPGIKKKKHKPSSIANGKVAASPKIRRTKSLDNSEVPKESIKRNLSLDLYKGPERLPRDGPGRGMMSPGRGRGRPKGTGSIHGTKGSIHKMKQDRPKKDRSRSSERRHSNGEKKRGRSRSVESKTLNVTGSRSGRSHSSERRGRGRRSRSKEKARTPSVERSYIKGQIPRGRQRTDDETQPKSILRRSSHHQSVGHRSSHHRSSTTLTTAGTSMNSQQAKRFSMDMKRGNSLSKARVEGHSSSHSEIEPRLDEDNDHHSFAMEDQIEKVAKGANKPLVRSLSRTMKQSIRSLVSMDLSGHSTGLGTSSHHTHRRNGLLRSKSNSARSMMLVEKSEWEDENCFIRSLRYLRILAPHPNEHPIKKRIRIVTWLALTFDFLNALVAVITYTGYTTQCCGKSIMSAFGGGVNWDRTILIVTAMYMILIFLEVLPVLKDVFPFNLFNPVVGFLITFAVFFSDSITEAAIMWVVEAFAVLSEIVGYRLRLKLFAERKAKLKHTKNEIKRLRKIKRKVKNRFDNGETLVRSGSYQDVLDIDYSESDSFAADEATVDIETQTCSNTSRVGLTTVSDIGNFRETRLLRDRRQLIRSQAELETDLRYHLIGVSVNAFLVIFSLLMIVIIAKNGGMCIQGMSFGNIFKDDQLDKCFSCSADQGVCQYCPKDSNGELIVEESFCYYPYGFGMKDIL